MARNAEIGDQYRAEVRHRDARRLARQPAAALQRCIHAMLAGSKQPAALGRSARESFPEIWDVIWPMFDQVLNGGAEAVAARSDFLLRRNGRGLELRALSRARRPAFVNAMAATSAGIALVSTIVSLGHTLGHKVAAGGVEIEKQSRPLRLLDCDEMQGFYFRNPVPSGAFEILYLNPSAR